MNLIITCKGNAQIFINDSMSYLVMELNGDQLLEIFKALYNNPGQFNFAYQDLLAQITNPVEREVTKQILHKMQEFDENSSSLMQEIDEKFPEF